jgi:multiple sugar transport system permease protein
MIPLYIIISRFGWVDRLIGIMVPAMMSGFGIFLMRQYMHTVPSELIDAARVDGAPELRIFMTLVLPLTIPALSALGILTALWSWDDFLWPLIVISTKERFTIPLGLAIFNQAEWVRAEATMMAGSTLAIFPVLLMFLLFQKQFIRGIALSGMKS